MKYYKLIPIRITATVLLFLLAIGWTGCTKNFEERNTNPGALESLKPTEIVPLFPTALYNGWNQGSYQTGQNLLADMYAQYFFCTQVAFGTHRYVMNQMWLQNFWSSTYVATMSPL